MSRPPSKGARAELAELAKANRGILRPTDVVDYARDKHTALHKCFEWSDSEAAELYRQEQARHLIRCCIAVVQVPDDGERQTRLYVSLRDDRGSDPYRVVTDVLRDPQRRKLLLTEALRELQSFRRKYSILKELAPVFAAAEKIAARSRRVRVG